MAFNYENVVWIGKLVKMLFGWSKRFGEYQFNSKTLLKVWVLTDLVSIYVS